MANKSDISNEIRLYFRGTLCTDQKKAMTKVALPLERTNLPSATKLSCSADQLKMSGPHTYTLGRRRLRIWKSRQIMNEHYPSKRTKCVFLLDTGVKSA